ATEARQLAAKLGECDRVGAEARAHLRSFAARLAEHPEHVVTGSAPGLLIRQLASVGRSGCPGTLAEARAQLTEAAWRRAATGSRRLSRLDERLLERLFARLACRDRAPDEPGPW